MLFGGENVWDKSEYFRNSGAVRFQRYRLPNNTSGGVIKASGKAGNTFSRNERAGRLRSRYCGRKLSGSQLVTARRITDTEVNLGFWFDEYHLVEGWKVANRGPGVLRRLGNTTTRDLVDPLLPF